MRLARFLADTQVGSTVSELADVLFINRPDSRPVDSATIGHVSKKFKTWTCVSDRQETGWPAGCNGLFTGAMNFAYRRMSANKLPKYKALFVCEADAIPLSADWLPFLHREWDRVSRKAEIAGALVPAGVHGRAHINGGCTLISADLKFLNWLTMRCGGSMMRGAGGWDWVLAPEFARRGWADIPGIKSWWKTPTISLEAVEAARNSGVVFLHGVKDNTCELHSRSLILSQFDTSMV
jgi:hypothetical protein